MLITQNHLLKGQTINFYEVHHYGRFSTTLMTHMLQPVIALTQQIHGRGEQEKIWSDERLKVILWILSTCFTVLSILIFPTYPIYTIGGL